MYLADKLLQKFLSFCTMNQLYGTYHFMVILEHHVIIDIFQKT